MEMYAEAKQSHSNPSKDFIQMSFPNSLEITISQCITPKTNAWMTKPYNKDEEKKETIETEIAFSR